MMQSFSQSSLVITSSDIDVQGMSTDIDTNISGDDPQFMMDDSFFADETSLIQAASHAFEDGPNSSDADKARNSKEGLAIQKTKFDQLSEQEKKELGQKVRSQDNIHTDDEVEGEKSKKYKSGKGKLQKMGNAGNRSTNTNGAFLCTVIICLICLFVNV